MNAYQSWSNVLNYIKDEMGAGLMKLEITDSKIIKKLYDNVLPEFSSYSGLHKYYKMTENNIVSRDPILVYEFIDFDHRILEVKSIIGRSCLMGYEQGQLMNAGSGDITDYLVRQNYIDMAEVTRADDTYRFLSPNKLEFQRAYGSYKSYEYIVELNCIHESPETIDADLYVEFKQLCCAYIMNVIGKIRKKYNNMTTPFGDIQLNADELINDSKEIKREVMEKLSRVPMEQFIWVL